jgi:hypothetical protein
MPKAHRHPKHPDHRRRPHRDRPGVRVRLLRRAGLQGAAEEGFRVILVNSNPATIMTDPEMADATYIEPINWRVLERIIERSARCAAAHHGRADGAELRARPGPRGRAGALRRRDDRRLARGHRQGRGPRPVPPGHAPHRPRICRARPSPTAWRRRTRCRRRSAFRPSSGRPSPWAAAAAASPTTPRSSRDLPPRARPVADQRAADRGVGARLEGVRDGGGARPRGQLHHHLLHRELRRHGRAHRRLDHRRAGADADRQGVPDHARRLAGGAARDRRRHRRLQRAVRDQPGRRAHDHHRDEPARLALSALASKATGFPIAKVAAKLAVGLHAGRAAQRDHRRCHAGLVRAEHRLRGHQGPALRVREVPQADAG